MTPLLVLNVVGLTRSLLARFPGKAPALEGLVNEGQSATLGTVLPAVTTSAQATFLTGLMPREHGIVANGWYFRDLAEVHYWKQSNYLVSGEKLWEAARKRDKRFTSAQICWWYNMYSTNDVAGRCGLSPGRILLLRRELYDSWTSFHGEAATATA